MSNKDFDNERDAFVFRNAKRNEGHAASIYTYGKDKYRIKVVRETKEEQSKAQTWLSHQAWKISKDIEELTRIKELIASPNFGREIEDSVLVAKKLDQEHWFRTVTSVIEFFDGVFNLEKIRELIDIALLEYEEDWNDKQGDYYPL